MNVEWKQKWLDALRSGKYKQGTGVLRDQYNRFCCLGVLCDVYDNSRWSDCHYSFEGVSRLGTPPRPLQEHLEVDGSQVDYLVGLNDDERAPFTKIADYIEANL